MRVLVCGGAGYVGAHAVKMLAMTGHDVTVFDNLSTGHRAAVRWGKFVEGDLLDTEALKRLFAEQKFDGVMHFCAMSQVGESVQRPPPVLPQQRNWQFEPARSHDAGRCRSPGIFVHGGGLRSARERGA